MKKNQKLTHGIDEFRAKNKNDIAKFWSYRWGTIPHFLSIQNLGIWWKNFQNLIVIRRDI